MFFPMQSEIQRSSSRFAQMKNDPPLRESPRNASGTAPTPRVGMPWTDFHLVLTVAREASVARACKVLGMTHSTLLRKIDQVESRLKTRLFDRVRGRYTLTPAGHEINDAAGKFEPIARGAETRARGQDLRPSGHVRVSVASVVLDHLLPPVLAQFASAFPDVQIELSASRCCHRSWKRSTTSCRRCPLRLRRCRRRSGWSRTLT